MKVTDLKHNEGIHCPTKEQANKICMLMHQAGLKWVDNRSYLELSNNWDRYKEKTCYFPKFGTYGMPSFNKIYSAEIFIRESRESKINKILK